MSEQGILWAVMSAVGTGLSTAVVTLWRSVERNHKRTAARLNDCETDRAELRARTNQLGRQVRYLRRVIEGQHGNPGTREHASEPGGNCNPSIPTK